MTESDSEDDLKSIEINYDLYTSLIDSFESELKKIFKSIAKKYGEDYFFNCEDLFNFYKEHTLEFRYKIQPPITKNKKEDLPEEELPEDNDLETIDADKTEKKIEKKTERKISQKVSHTKEDIQCFARVWSGGYMDDKQYGERCQRKRLKDLDYCRQHKDHLVHGRFDQEPSKIIKGFFIKHNDPSHFKDDPQDDSQDGDKMKIK
jgi:hypothetical protein